MNNKGDFKVPNKYKMNDIESLIKSKRILKSRDRGTTKKIENILGKIFKNISEIIQLNYIFDSDIDSYYCAKEIIEDLYYDR